jgi:hypothetical protein
VADGDSAAPQLVLGLLLRYAGETDATIWVETKRACLVEILGRRVRTFQVAGHRYGLVLIDGLRPGTECEYQVNLDGVRGWPDPGSQFLPSVLPTLAPGRPTPARHGERVRRAADLEHWAAFGQSFTKFEQLLTGLATGRTARRLPRSR